MGKQEKKFAYNAIFLRLGTILSIHIFIFILGYYYHLHIAYMCDIHWKNIHYKCVQYSNIDPLSQQINTYFLIILPLSLLLYFETWQLQVQFLYLMLVYHCQLHTMVHRKSDAYRRFLVMLVQVVPVVPVDL